MFKLSQKPNFILQKLLHGNNIFRSALRREQSFVFVKINLTHSGLEEAHYKNMKKKIYAD